MATPYLRYINKSTIPARTKYRALNPRMANIFEEIIMNVSLVIAITAGIESTANIISDDSIRRNVRNIVVANTFPFILMKKFFP
jgi:succinate dehydrogenase hydrophobic anchor subunit